MILYIHGFRSKGDGEKAKALQAYFPNEKVISPSLTTKPLEDAETLKDIIFQYSQEKIIVIGTSLGGFYAHYLSRIFHLNCFLINPSFNPWESLKDSLGVNTVYGSEKEGDLTPETFELTQEHLNQFEHLGNEINVPLSTYSKALINLIISVDDEVINHAETLVKFRDCKIKLFDNAGHIFTKFEEILPNVKIILEN